MMKKPGILGNALLAGSFAATAQTAAPPKAPSAGEALQPESIRVTVDIPPVPLMSVYAVPATPATPPPADNCTVDGLPPEVPFGTFLSEPPLSSGQAFSPVFPSSAAGRDAAPVTAEALFGFKESDVKFSVPRLVDMLGDAAHENLVLAAYPDPIKGTPLIGAGFRLDLPPPPVNDHPQIDPDNPVQFKESGTAELWAASGLAPERLASILDRYNARLEKYGAAEFNRMARIGMFPPDISGEEALRLTRTAVIKSVHNAQGYYPPEKFARLTASQQMALVEMVYQMNIEGFANFLNALNGNHLRAPKSESHYAHAQESTGEHWKDIQLMLSQSKWASRQTPERAIRVIAKFDPQYNFDHPQRFENNVRAMTGLSHSHKHRPEARLAKLERPLEEGRAHSVSKKNAHHHGIRS